MTNRTYRYMEGEALYPFGFGLSYTKYKYGNLTCLPDENGNVLVSVAVKNDGMLYGEEVVQVYVKNLDSPLAVSNHTLCAFARVGLEAGQERTVNFCLPAHAFYVVDQSGQRRPDGRRFAAISLRGFPCRFF